MDRVNSPELPQNAGEFLRSFLARAFDSLFLSGKHRHLSVPSLPSKGRQVETGLPPCPCFCVLPGSILSTGTVVVAFFSVPPQDIGNDPVSPLLLRPTSSNSSYSAFERQAFAIHASPELGKTKTSFFHVPLVRHSSDV